MERKGLLIGIDFSDEFCKICYFNERHNSVETVVPPAGSMRYLIPSVVCFSQEKQDWIIGEEAKEYSLKTGAFLFDSLLSRTLSGEKYSLNNEELYYDSLLAVFIEKALDMTRKFAGVFPIRRVNICLRRVNMQIKEVMEQVFSKVGIEKEKLRLLNYAECFAYFISWQDPALWEDGAGIFDLSKDGFYFSQLTFSKENLRNIFYINERNCSMDLSVKDLENEVLRPRADEKLNRIYEEVKTDAETASIYFTGSGFEELWFSNTLKNISRSRRAFRGNNIYAKGACLEGYLREEGVLCRITVVCRPRTRAYISIEAKKGKKTEDVVLSPAAVDWYEASGSADFILDETRTLNFKVTSLLSREETEIAFDLSSFPERPPKTTRVRARAEYINEFECELSAVDLGFGNFFPGSGTEVKKILDLEEYI